MFAQLGEIKFELLTSPSVFDSRRSHRFAEHEVIEGKNRLQFTGDNLEELDITVAFHASFCSPKVKVAEINKAALEHRALPLVFGNGEFKGYFVITNVFESMQWTHTDGSVFYTQLQLVLKEYANYDAIQAAVEQKKAAAQGLKRPGGQASSLAQRVAPAPAVRETDLRKAVRQV